ncbi:MAG: Ca2+-dependent phosphoinositide-specific phospholipase C, partial [Bacteroidota bacterium]
IHEDRIIKPDDIRGGYATLEDAALAGNWPKLEESRGKFLFVLDEGPQKRAVYLKDHPNLLGRVMFVDADPGDPAAAFIIFNDPIKHLDSIQSLVRMGYMVRTRADANTLEARVGDLARLQAALKSGAQFISTDYYLDENPFGTRYKAELPNKQNWILNPVLYAN